MIGLDAADFEYIRASIAVLPTLSGALARGVWRRLLSPADLLPGCVWPTFYTGSAPGEHGIYHHLQWDARAMRLRRVTPAWLACEPFWCDFERRGLRVTVVDVPMSFPSRLDVGIEVANWGSHDQLGPLAIQPGALRAEFEGRFGVAHAMGAEIPVNKTRRELRSILKRLVNGAAQKAELIRWLCLRTEWDFLLAVFGETHRGGHILWPEEIDGLLPEGALRDVYAAVDKAVGQVLAALPRDTLVILFSLHGMGANTSQEHFVAPVVDRVNAHFIDGPHVSDRGDRRGMVRRLREGIPARLQNAIARNVPVSIRDRVVDRQISGGHNWARTPGFDILADLNGYLRLNIRGRELEGMLEPGSPMHERYVDWMRTCFESLRSGDSGDRLVRDVIFTSRALPGSRCDRLPDAVVTWTGAPPAVRVVSDRVGAISARLRTGRGGNHRPDGFAIVLEPGAEISGEAPPFNVIDFVAMIRGRMLKPAP